MMSLILVRQIIYQIQVIRNSGVIKKTYSLTTNTFFLIYTLLTYRTILTYLQEIVQIKLSKALFLLHT